MSARERAAEICHEHYGEHEGVCSKCGCHYMPTSPQGRCLSCGDLEPIGLDGEVTA